MEPWSPHPLRSSIPNRSMGARRAESPMSSDVTEMSRVSQTQMPLGRWGGAEAMGHEGLLRGWLGTPGCPWMSGGVLHKLEAGFRDVGECLFGVHVLT